MLVVRVLATLSLALAAVPACGLFSRRADADVSPASSEILLEVDSHHWSDIVIYLMNGTQSQRLGMVAGVSSSRFVVSYRQIATGGKVRLRADPVGGQRSFTSEDVVVQPRQSIRWTLESDLSRSSLAVF
ncbi:MAG TPA: hypothetical protein VNO19_01555 [Gemmatimonadales bacterium]|nr:hypothetical protein [Gemmatimonadales bacterium]